MTHSLLAMHGKPGENAFTLAGASVALSSVPVTRAGDVVAAPVRHAGDWLVVDLQLVDLLDERTRSTVESGLPGI